MGFAWLSLAKDLARRRRDLVAVALWLAIPLMIGGLITALIGNEGGKPHGVLLIVDEDESFLSELVASAYSAGELGEMLSVEKTTYADGLGRVNDGEASALLLIPEGFANAMLESEPVTLTLKTNPAQVILPGIIRDVTEILLDGGFYLHRLFADEIETFSNLDETPDDALIAAMSVQIQDKIEVIAPKLFPPVIDVEVVEPPAEEVTPPVALLFLPGIVLMAVMFSANGMAGDFWKERDQGTLRRLVWAPGRVSLFVAGKALAAAVIIAIISGIALGVGFLYHGVPWSRLPSSLVWVSLSGVALFAWFAALQMLFTTRKAAELVSTVLVFPLLMIGGSFFPLDVMPDWIATIGRLSPNGFVVDRLTAEITTDGAWNIAAGGWAGVTAAAVTGLGLCSWRLNGRFSRA